MSRHVSEIINKIGSSSVNVIQLFYIFKNYEKIIVKEIWRIINYWRIRVFVIIIKRRRGRVMMIINVSEYIIIKFWGLIRVPDHFHRFLFQSLCFVLVIDSREKESIEAHLWKNRGLRILVSKWINVPTYSRDNTKGIFKPLY